MKVINTITDNRINATNLLIETTLGEYDQLASSILKENPFQRKRVKTAGTIYSLLKSDLKEGIVIPPIVLGLSLTLDVSQKTNPELIQTIEQYKNKLIILDGLQRTYTIRDLINELSEKNDPDLEKVKENPLRIEIYVGINKLGILYRMLTLNTGQTPMSSRHQIEIIYSDYIETGIDKVKLIKQIDDKAPAKLAEYNFRDIIDGFTSYLERDYLTIERTDILDNIKSLEKLAIENQNKDLFVQFVKSYDSLAKKMNQLSDNWTYNPEETNKKLGGPAFAKNVIYIFNKSQVMTGFGSAIGKLIDLNAVKTFDEIEGLIRKISSRNMIEDLNNLIGRLDDLRSVAVKIGNDQRLFFHYLFRELFDNKSDGYLNFGEAIHQAYSQYERRTK
jgi:hypothetical protein